MMEQMDKAHELARSLLTTALSRPLDKEEKLCLKAVMGHLNAFHRVMEVIRLKNLDDLRKQYYELDIGDNDDEPDGDLTQQTPDDPSDPPTVGE